MIPTLTPSIPISRKVFTIYGLVLMGIKYNIDRLFAIVNNRQWFITDYFVQPDHLAVTELSEADEKFYFGLVLLSLPFIAIGTILCMKRMLDAAMPRWMVILFFIPFVNLIFFFVLCILPGKTNTDSDHKPRFLENIIPKSDIGSMLFSIVITLIIGLAFTLFSVDVLEEYGWGLFIGVPFFIGFSSVLLYAYHHHPVTLRNAIAISMGAITVFAALLFFLAMEGLICIAMAAPIAYPVALLGAFLAYAVQSYSPKATFNCITIHILLIPFLMWSEQESSKNLPVYELKTGITVNAPPQVVWEHLVTFNTIAAPDEWIFKTGIAYPTDAVITGNGVGAVRKCNFTTGSFIEPITCWQEPELLQFNVLQQPQPMFELSVYNKVHAVHLDGYFQSVRGQFHLVPLPDGKTYLEGTTWYKNKMWPLTYWKVWSDFVLHKIHFRVLNHIKIKSEAGSQK